MSRKQSPANIILLNGYKRATSGRLSQSERLIPNSDDSWVPISVTNQEMGRKTLLCCAAPDHSRQFYADFSRHMATLGWLVVCIDNQRQPSATSLSVMGDSVNTVPGSQCLSTVINWINRVIKPSQLVALGHQSETAFLDELQGTGQFDAIVMVAEMRAGRLSHTSATYQSLARVFQPWKWLSLSGAANTEPEPEAIGRQGPSPLLYIGTSAKASIDASLQNHADTCWVLQNEQGENFRFRPPVYSQINIFLVSGTGSIVGLTLNYIPTSKANAVNV